MFGFRQSEQAVFVKYRSDMILGTKINIESSLSQGCCIFHTEKQLGKFDDVDASQVIIMKQELLIST